MYFIEVHRMDRLIGHSMKMYLTANREFVPTACEKNRKGLCVPTRLIILELCTLQLKMSFPALL